MLVQPGKPAPYPVCSKEAFDLLNCAVSDAFDQEKCLRLLGVLRKCVVQKNVKKFILEENDPDDHRTGKGKQ
ncbi:hypothetical protein Taro_008247 [Colocasia esculenta]|uniref:CHCH domain-containing protein n=1 Tax=Colocasia esculenta TaxID=4460 RepID=A0A843TT83_COLES|nr:hypothetical protein [Colocasia esculenta]